METYLVIYYDGYNTKHGFLQSETPDSTNPLAWNLNSEYEIIAVVDVAASAVEAIWIDESVVHPAKEIDPAAEHADASVVESTSSSTD